MIEKEITKEDLLKVRKLTNDNAHTEARIECASIINNNHLLELYSYIHKSQYRLGYITEGLILFRSELDTLLYKVMRNKLTNEDYDLLRSCL